jgi:hypothetical protein
MVKKLVSLVVNVSAHDPLIIRSILQAPGETGDAAAPAMLPWRIVSEAVPTAAQHLYSIVSLAFSLNLVFVRLQRPHGVVARCS